LSLLPLTFSLYPFSFHLFPYLLIPKPVLVPAVRALPGDGVAGHAPDVFMHAFLADIEAASTAPAEAKFLAAAVALMACLSAVLAPVIGGRWRLFHGCCFTI
jgi:hypothetical protein